MISLDVRSEYDRGYTIGLEMMIDDPPPHKYAQKRNLGPFCPQKQRELSTDAFGFQVTLNIYKKDF